MLTKQNYEDKVSDTKKKFQILKRNKLIINIGLNKFWRTNSKSFRFICFGWLTV